MKFKANPANNGVLTFNDLGTDIKGVSSQEKNVRLNPGQVVYLPDQSGVLYSATKGDAHRYAVAGMLTIDDLVVAPGALVLNHSFNYMPTVTCTKLVAGAWVDAIVGVDYTTSTNAALTITTVTTLAANVYVRIS